MKRRNHLLRIRRSAVGWVCLGLIAAIAGPVAAGTPAFAASHRGDFVFSLLPKSLQKDPKIDVTVITEMTPAGEKLKPATAQHPVYFEGHATGYHDEGQGVTGERPLPVTVLQSRLEKSLTAAHYLQADAVHPPQLVVFFVWGAANRLDPDSGAEDIGYHNFLSRAALVGGDKFARQLAQVLTQEDDQALAGVKTSMAPLKLFMERSDENRDLVEQAERDCYYVVVSAYDAAALHEGRRVLLWRTSMTANSAGVSMEDTLPALILAAGPYWGRNMPVAAMLSGSLVPEGHVEIGTPTVLPDKHRAKASVP